jgi:hypothetical protein
MLKKIATAGVLTAAIGGVLLNAGPALADDGKDGKGGHKTDVNNVQIVPIQLCRDVLGLNLLSYEREDGPCANGPVVDN